jgi:hypothetical protein
MSHWGSSSPIPARSKALTTFWHVYTILQVPKIGSGGGLVIEGTDAWVGLAASGVELPDPHPAVIIITAMTSPNDRSVKVEPPSSDRPIVLQRRSCERRLEALLTPCVGHRCRIGKEFIPRRLLGASRDRDDRATAHWGHDQERVR